jgi:AcrR family transcriptional regulator
MPHPAGKKAESRARILASAGQGFRRHGYGGLGVDGLAKAAGVTSGAFYAHFKSKAEAFRETVRTGMLDLAHGIAGMRDAGGGWPVRFVEFYLTDRRTCDLGEACALQSLTGEVERADEDTRNGYTEGLREAIATLETGMADGTDPERRAQAIALLALISGGVSMARAVNDPALSDEIIAALRSAASRTCGV